MKKLLTILISIALVLVPIILAESSVNDSLNSSNDSLNLTIQNNSEDNSSIINVEENNETPQEINQKNSNDLYYCPQNDGYVGEIADENMHDSGLNGAGDSLEIYCRNNIIRLCLSEEPCPWRNSISSNDQSTCNGNYGNSPMAFSANEKGINIAELVGTGSQKIENIYCNSKDNGYSPGWNAEISGTNENNEENHNGSGANANATQSGCYSGCLYQASCIPFGYRLKNEQNESVYCDISKEFKLQKRDNSSCQNDFECLSNQCVEGTCINLQKTLEETNTALQKIIDFLKKLFGFG
jgi:hypothetical protein